MRPLGDYGSSLKGGKAPVGEKECQQQQDEQADDHEPFEEAERVASGLLLGVVVAVHWLGPSL